MKNAKTSKRKQVPDDPIARIAMAEKLERKAAELREFKKAPVEAVVTASVLLRPRAKEAVLHYAKNHGCEETMTEQDRLDCGTRWIIEQAICILDEISVVANKHVRYRNAEDLESSSYLEDLAAAALTRHKKRFALDDSH